MTTPPSAIILITGGASGIGLECAKQMASAGASIAIVDLNIVAAEEALADLPGGPHLAVEANVADPESMARAVDSIAADLGHITGVVTAAGVVSRTPLKDVTAEEFRRVFAINVEGTQNTIAAAASHLIEADGGGAIVALTSVASYTGGGLMGSGVYAASKAAVVGLTRGYARELSEWKVRANAVAPAATVTPMTSVLTSEEKTRMADATLIGRLSLPQEIAATVSFLLSPGAASITGQVIQANGGVYFN